MSIITEILSRLHHQKWKNYSQCCWKECEEEWFWSYLSSTIKLQWKSSFEEIFIVHLMLTIGVYKNVGMKNKYTEGKNNTLGRFLDWKLLIFDQCLTQGIRDNSTRKRWCGTHYTILET